MQALRKETDGYPEGFKEDMAEIRAIETRQRAIFADRLRAWGVDSDEIGAALTRYAHRLRHALSEVEFDRLAKDAVMDTEEYWRDK